MVDWWKNGVVILGRCMSRQRTFYVAYIYSSLDTRMTWYSVAMRWMRFMVVMEVYKENAAQG